MLHVLNVEPLEFRCRFDAGLECVELSQPVSLTRRNRKDLETLISVEDLVNNGVREEPRDLGTFPCLICNVGQLPEAAVSFAKRPPGFRTVQRPLIPSPLCLPLASSIALHGRKSNLR